MEVERIKYERTGGFAGMRIATDFKPEALPEEQARVLLDLLDDLDFDELPENMMSDSPMPDQFTYQITVETNKGQHTVIAGESSAPEKLQELFRLLDRIAQSRKQ
jgi:hypothetical protein